MNASSIMSIVIPICLLVVALGAALAYFVVRNRRLSNSFTQFANSHYDTRRGQATFPGTVDAGLGKLLSPCASKQINDFFSKLLIVLLFFFIGEEDDNPVIRGFSDDEPLVIA